MSDINININLNLDKNKAPKNKQPKSTVNKKKKKKIKFLSPPQLPWGLNQERLKNYIEQQLIKRDNLILQQQKRKIKTEEPKQDRREILGVSFLNRLPETKVKTLIHKTKAVEINEETQIQYHNHPKFSDEQLYQIRMYKEWKHHQIQMQIQAKKYEEIEKHVKIQQNLKHLNEFIRDRNSSVHHKKSVSFHKKKRIKSSMTDKSKVRHLLSRHAQSNDQRDNQSYIGFALDSDAEGISQMDSIHKSSRRQNVISEPSLDEEEEKQVRELGNLQKQMSQIVKAAIIIQKVWRGHKTRKVIEYYKQYLQDDKNNESDNENNKVQPICQSVQIGQEQSDIKSQQQGLNTFIDQLNWYDDEDNSSNLDKIKQIDGISPLNSIKKISDQKSQKSQNKLLMDQHKNKWHQMLDHISQLQRKGSKQNVKELLSELKLFTIQCTQEIEGVSPQQISQRQEKQQQKQSEIKQLNIDVPLTPKDSVELSEMRQALGSEYLVYLSQSSSPVAEDASLFEQNPFLDFASKKFRELLNRDNMNKLIKMRETAIEERRRNEESRIQQAFQKKQITPNQFEKQRFKIEKWVNKEKEDLKFQRKNIENGWRGLFETFMRTQKDLLFMSKLKNQQLTTSFSSENVSNMRLVREITSNSQSKIVKTNCNLDTAGMNLSQSICESQDIRQVPKSSPSPSPRKYNHQEIIENLDWDDEMLYTSDNIDNQEKQSEIIKISQLVKKEQTQLTDPQLQSYSILIANSIIGNEVQEMYDELIQIGKDITIFQKQIVTRGIKTNIQQVKIYLNLLQEHLLKTSDVLIERINVPLGPTPKELLKFFHFYDDDDEEIISDQNDSYSNQAILFTEQFAILEKLLIEQGALIQDDEFLLELEHIHNKVIYDAMNEALDYFRPFGLNGYPLPWIKQAGNIVQRIQPIAKTKEILEGAIKKVIEWSSAFVGLIIDKPDSPFPKMLIFDQEYLQQIKEERMVRMLNNEVLQNEERWLNYDEEQSEILIDLATMIHDQLIEEVIKEIIQH